MRKQRTDTCASGLSSLSAAHPSDHTEEKARAHASINEHRAIAEALKARDARTAEECARLHIRNTISNMDKVGWENLMK